MVPFAIAQEEQVSLGGEEEESLADSIVSEVLDDDHNAVLDQDNTASQGATSTGLQDQEGAQEQNRAQEAANTNVDSDSQVGVQGQQQSSPTPTQPPTPEPPGTPGEPGTPGLPGPPGATVITITGTTSDEKVWIQEHLHESEICTFAGVIVSGPGVTRLGQVPSCPNNEPYGWDISPNPDGLDTIYRLEGNGISTGTGNADRVEIHDGAETDNDVYDLDVNQFSLFDGLGDDSYHLVADLVDFGESVGYSDSLGNDRMTFSEEG